ncbi:MAG: hypothetical protein FWG82_01010 [Oscillospiraceae bacterium]|nr:hypothetical protein [Oscillospiraceae bacterium]
MSDNTLNQKSPLNFAIRIIYYLAGMFFIALGVQLAIRGGLGISPVSSPAYAINTSLRFHYEADGIVNLLGIDIPADKLMGYCAAAVFICLVLVQIILLRKNFKPIQILQVAVAILFGYFVNVALPVVRLIKLPKFATYDVDAQTGLQVVTGENLPYYMQLVFLAMSIITIALGLSFYLGAKLIPMPSEGVGLAVQQKLDGVPYHKIKVVTDVIWVSIASVIVFISVVRIGGGQFTGIREGTVITAVLVGIVMGWMRPVLNPIMRKCGLDVEIPVKKSKN